MSDYIEHKTKAGARFDHLAYRYYGDANRTAEIIAANRDQFPPEGPVPAVLEHGLVLRIPVLDEIANDDDLPPWKRGQNAPAGA